MYLISFRPCHNQMGVRGGVVIEAESQAIISTPGSKLNAFAGFSMIICRRPRRGSLFPHLNSVKSLV
jgi:hypothetical protein